MNSYQVTLFFAKDTKYNTFELSNSLLQNITDIGEPILLPNNASLPKEANFPLIIFNKNKKIQITTNYQCIITTIERDEDIEIKDLILNINNAVSKSGINVVRIGYGYKTQLNKELIDNFKSYNFQNDELKNSMNFELSWLMEIDINQLKVNCWQRYFTDPKLEYLNVIFDINTKAEEIHEIDNNFLEKFINESEEFINEKIFK